MLFSVWLPAEHGMGTFQVTVSFPFVYTWLFLYWGVFAIGKSQTIFKDKNKESKDIFEIGIFVAELLNLWAAFSLYLSL